MANLRTSADIISTALFAAGEATDGTSDYTTQAVVYLNRGYQAIWMGGAEIDPDIHEEWEWLKSTTPYVINLNPVITAGTVQVTNNSTGIIFSSAPAITVQGRFFKVEGRPDVFRIASHTAASTSAVLDGVYTGPDAATASYKAFQLEYDISTSILRIMDPMRVYRDDRTIINKIDLSVMERRWRLWNVQSGVPYDFAQIGESKVRFSHYGSVDAGDYIRVDFDYMLKPNDLANDTSEPVIPHHWRKILADYVTAKVMLDKNDSRATMYGISVKDTLRAMKRENDHKMIAAGMEAGHISPRQDDHPSNMFPLRTTGGLIIG